MSKLHHENIVELIGVIKSSKPSQVGYITELADCGALNDILSDASKEVNGEHVFKYSLDIARGMAFLSSRNIVHRDLKSANVLVFSAVPLPMCKICDFG